MENEAMSHPTENDAAGAGEHSPEHPISDISGDRREMHERALDAALAQMADAISVLRAPASVRRRCLSEQRRQAAQSWRGAASAAGLLVIAALCWVSFAAPDINPFGRHRPAVSGSPAAASSQAASGHPASDGGMAAEDAGYVSLPYSDSTIANGTETTLEVSMPVSQLMAWGVPAPGDGADDVIPVNLVLGADGLPMAVQVLPATDSTSANIEELYP